MADKKKKNKYEEAERKIKIFDAITAATMGRGANLGNPENAVLRVVRGYKKKPEGGYHQRNLLRLAGGALSNTAGAAAGLFAYKNTPSTSKNKWVNRGQKLAAGLFAGLTGRNLVSKGLEMISGDLYDKDVMASDIVRSVSSLRRGKLNEDD